MTLVFDIKDLKKTYRMGRVEVPVLRGVSLQVKPSETVAILGASGSGKSTLLHLMGGLDSPDRGGGEIVFRDAALGCMSARRLDQYRRRSVGFVFQFYHLLPELTVMENVVIAAMAAEGLGYLTARSRVRARAQELLTQVGLGHRLKHRPAELSGGERQRVAIARALVNRPAVLLADEPTGNLDRVTGAQILDMLAALQRSDQTTFVIVTHDPETAARADRTVRLQDGRVVT